MPSFNGWNILTLPAWPPAPREIEWQLDDVIATARAPFSQQQQAYDWQNALLSASLSYPPMSKITARAWFAFLTALRGVTNVFQFGDPLWEGPQNPAAVPGTVTGSGQTGFGLLTSSSGLTPGDWFSIGLRLYMVTSVSGGTLGIWPNLRESPADGSDLVVANPQGLFRLTKNQRVLSVDYMRFYGLTFEIEEAR